MFNYQCLDRTSHSCSSRNGFHGGQGREYATPILRSGSYCDRGGGPGKGRKHRPESVSGAYIEPFTYRLLAGVRRLTSWSAMSPPCAVSCPRSRAISMSGSISRALKSSASTVFVSGVMSIANRASISSIEALPQSNKISEEEGVADCVRNASLYNVYEAGPEGPDARTRPGRIGNRPENLGDIPCA